MGLAFLVALVLNVIGYDSQPVAFAGTVLTLDETDDAQADAKD